ncbi:MAG: type II toxin-antitoxin system HigB family toxin [Bacteroidia bacterium]|nr:type II toxin-antitoxin system HigB family toxin [Bacteroidia bacterium]
MQIIGSNNLVKLLRKNRGNKRLTEAAEQLRADLEKACWRDRQDLQQERRDADCVYEECIFFFDIHLHRVLALVEYSGEDEDGTVMLLWAGSHSAYERTFKNNRNTIEKWLKDRNYIY